MRSSPSAVFVDHEAAADRVVDGDAHHAPVLVRRSKAHAVRVMRQGLAPVQHQVVLLDERNGLATEQREPSRGADPRQPLGHALGVDRLRRRALEAQHHRLVAAMTDAGRAERAEQLGPDRCHLLEETVLLESARKGQCRAHRPHRVRARRADPDLEQVEHADRHDATSLSASRAAARSIHEQSSYRSARSWSAEITRAPAPPSFARRLVVVTRQSTSGPRVFLLKRARNTRSATGLQLKPNRPAPDICRKPSRL